jgi:hypothetical protein
VARPLWHVISALVPAYVAFAKHGGLAGASVLAGAVAVDGDHLVDWALNGGREDYSTRIVVPGHGWEFGVAAIVAARTGLVPAPWRAAAVAFGAGLTCHLILDHARNRPETLLGYAFLWRLANGFDRHRSGWLPSAAWVARYVTSSRPASLPAIWGAAVATAIIWLATEDPA